MTAGGIERGYLRLRLAAALTLMVAAVVASHLVSHAQTQRIERRIETADAFDAALSALTEQLIALGAIEEVRADWLAADGRAELRRLLPVLEAACRRIHAGLASDAVSAEARAVLDDSLLDPLALLEEFAAIARAVAERSDLWGEAASPHVAAANSVTVQLLPVIRRVRALEAAELERATVRLEGVQRAGLALTFGLAIAVWALIFAPMERRVTAAQAAAREGRRAAEAASEAKSAFVATMSHEIRTPLTAVLGLADLLAEGRLPPEEEEMARTLASSGRALLAVVNDALDFSKLEAGRVAVEARPLDAAALVAELGRLFGPQAAGRGVALRVEVEGEPAPRHLGDEGRLRQVLANLLGNAVKFTPAGEVVLRLAAEPAQGGVQALRFEVRDTGVGIAPEALGRVFEAFEQADAGTARRHGGTGLGLAIARRLAVAMGGRLGAQSAPGRGSCFRLDLALPVAPAAPAADLGPARPEPGGPAPATGPLVLVVDDNAVNRRIAARLLERAGARVAQAEDGARAVEAALADRPDLVLMDVSMPGMDGFEATRRIRAAEAAEARRTPILALSAHVGEAHRARCAEAGMDGLLGKPFQREEIEAALARHAPPRPREGRRPAPPAGDPSEGGAGREPGRDPLAGDAAMTASHPDAARPGSGPGLAAVLAWLVLGLVAGLAPGPARAEDAPGPLAVLNWADYIDPAALDGFTAETGIGLRYDTYLDAEATEARLAAGGSGYDLAVVPVQYLGRLAAMGALAPFDLAALPGRARLDPAITARLDAAHPGGRHGVPYLWGTTGVGYDAAAVAARMPDAPVGSWRMVFDPEVVARFADCGVGIVGMPEEVVAAALAYLGRDPNSSDPADLAAALAALAAVAPHVRRWDAEASEGLATGELCVALIWSGDAAFAREAQGEGSDVAYAVPVEGAPIALDVLVLPADGARPEAAHRFVERLLRPEVAARITDEVLYASANAEALALVDPAIRADPVVHPPEAATGRLFLVRSRPPAEKAALARAWRRLPLGP